MTNTLKETKAQKVERLKRAMNPWEGLEEIRRFAREGFESIPPEWIGTYFRWWGVYTQGDGAGVTGGQGGEGGTGKQRFKRTEEEGGGVGDGRGTAPRSGSKTMSARGAPRTGAVGAAPCWVRES